MPQLKKADVTLAGSGSWATAMAMVLTANGNRVAWYVDRPEIYRHLRRYHQNPHYLKNITFDPELIIPLDDINEAVSASEVVILVTPAAFLKAGLEGMSDGLLSGRIVCSGIKGIVPGDNSVVGEYIHRNYNLPYDNIVIITGPSHAEEVSMQKLTYLTFASPDLAHAAIVERLFANSWIATSISEDIFGTEYAAVMKNIYAIAAGIADGLGYGDNFNAVLLANAAGEMRRFVEALSPGKREITDSPYLGDLLVTGYSKLSRNRNLGRLIGQGHSVANALQGMTQVAEGYYASGCINAVKQKTGAQAPIADAVYRILYKNASPVKELRLLTNKLR